MDVLYQPLSVRDQEIRMLRVEPVLHDSLISCTLHHASLLDKTVRYDAISWCWGDSTRRTPILLDGRSVDIPANAEEVLRELVIHHKRHGNVWLDAVCINQEDVDERSSQVGMMREVYSQADEVLIWLGKDDGFAPRAINSLRILAEHCEQEIGGPEDYETFMWLRRGSRLSRYFTYDPLPDGVDWEALRQLFATPLLLRVWAIQEISLATRPICFFGHDTFPWSSLGIAAEWMVYRTYERPQYCGQFMRGVMNAASICAVKRGRRDMDMLMITGVHFDASEPRDKVYGLLGLMMPAAGRELIKPDYRASRIEIFMNATRATISYCNRLWILATAERQWQHQIDATWPSWVMQCDYVWKRGPRGIRNHSSPGCDNGVPMQLDGETELNVLRLKGVPVATVAEAIGPLTPEIWDNNFELSRMVLDMLRLVEQLSLSEPGLDVVFKALTGDRHGKMRDDELSMRAHFDAFVAECQGLAGEEIVHSNGSADFYREHLRVGALYRSFYVTTDGHAGQCTSHPRSGDIVCILFGSDAPFILRPFDKRTRLVGHAYLAHVMDGSYVGRLEESGRLASVTAWFDIQ